MYGKLGEPITEDLPLSHDLWGCVNILQQNKSVHSKKKIMVFQGVQISDLNTASTHTHTFLLIFYSTHLVPFSRMKMLLRSLNLSMSQLLALQGFLCRCAIWPQNHAHQSFNLALHLPALPVTLGGVTSSLVDEGQILTYFGTPRQSLQFFGLRLAKVYSGQNK